MIDRDCHCVKKGNSASVEILSGDSCMLHHYKGKWPKLGERVYIAEGAQIVGDVEIGDHSSIWYNSVIRGDVYYVRIRSEERRVGKECRSRWSLYHEKEEGAKEHGS